MLLASCFRSMRILAAQLILGVAFGLIAVNFVVYYVWPPRLLPSHENPLEQHQPRMLLDRMTWDCGKVEHGTIVEAKFLVHNRGDRRLILRKTNGSCECLTTTDTEITIEPGGSHTLQVRFDTAKGSGPLQFELHYRTNDPLQPPLTLLILAQ